MKNFLTILFFCLLFSCETEQPQACPVVVVPDLLLSLVNDDGENLLENGTYDPEEITVTAGGITYMPNVTDVDSLYQNLINIRIKGVEGVNELLIRLSDTEVDMLTLDLEEHINESACGIYTSFTIIQAIYNDEVKEVQVFSDDFNKFIQVVKSS